MDPNQTPQNPEEQAAPDDHLLEDLVAATSLFNPAQIWQREVELEALDEQADTGTDNAERTEPPIV
ncbi:hypothetical protein ACFP2F_08385 [Hymenobacter artigasi]|uniref:Uncharacterized protein n=1 Tax=Hymenobacter artigasi TaxID=2719616 RepID=A0ABX1HJY7_9BACT|nr:hypothetical protein [Hymenobacter artigasi]NKI89271.1 hypothetical protein [Hymenobacter artigasi]